MKRRLKEPFGKAGLIVGIVALVFAMMGGAYAASHSGKATASAKAKKGPRGPKGPKGDTGPVGPTGPAGAPGKDGTNGSNGTNGASVTGKAVTGAPCPTGVAGVEYTSASGVNTVCNGEKGKNGTNGTNGSPWIAGGTLPASTEPGCPCTETGVWATGIALVGEEEAFVRVPISFNIPLAAPIAATNVHIFKTSEGIPTGCSGTLGGGGVTDLKADPGNLCVWTRLGPLLTPENPEAAEAGAGTHGVILTSVFSTVSGEAEAEGTWAVTAP